MKYPERMAILEAVPYESQLGYIAFCVERLLQEAQRHPVARVQVEQLPLLREGLNMLWARAERGEMADPSRIRAVLNHLETYERPAADSDDVLYNYDVILVEAARMLTKGMRVLLDSAAANPRYVAGALEGAVMAVGLVYADGRRARTAEVAVIDAALERLREWGAKPFSRQVFTGISEWTRGEVSKRYAERQLTGTKDEDAAT